ncbi:hypothetical protein ACLKA7_011598 [Drosophila subpalustris]
MHVQAMPKRRAVLPQALVSLPLLLLMLFTESLPANASGNYASSDGSVGSSLHHLHSEARDAKSENNKNNEDVASTTVSQQREREPKTYRDLDFSAYVNGKYDATKLHP